MSTRPPGSIVSRLSVPAEMRFWDLVQAYIRQMAIIAGYAEPETLAWELAAEEAFQNILQHAYPGWRRAAQDLTEIGGAEVVYLDLPLAQPATPLLCRQVEADGFFFAGVWPCEAGDGDHLRLQRVAVALDLQRLQIHPGLGSEVFAYVAAAMAVAQGRAPA